MYILTELAKTIQTVLGATADQLAKTTGFIKRQRQLTGAKLLRALTLGFLPKPAATLEELTPSGVLTPAMKMALTTGPVSWRFLFTVPILVTR